MRYQFIAAEQHDYAVVRLCQALNVSPSGYYAWRRRAVSKREMANQLLVARIEQVQRQVRYTYGSPRMHAELCAQGERCGRNRVARLMRKHNLGARHSKSIKRAARTGGPATAAPNLLGRDFQVAAPNSVWLADITYIPTAQGWLHLAVVMDLFSRRVIGWAMAKDMATALVRNAFRMAVRQRRPPSGLIHHSDRGSQYTSAEYRLELAELDIGCSLSAAGNCYDNAPMESFFATLKGELVSHERYQTRDEAGAAIFSYTEGFYNRIRRHSSLGYVSPDEFERAYYQQQEGLSS